MAYKVKTAFRPSERKKREVETVSLNVTPIMNLVVVLIPLLLQAVVFISLGRIDYKPPPTPSGNQQEALMTQAPERVELKLLDLVLNVTDTLMEVSIFEATSGDYFWSVPLKENGSYDFGQLQEILIKIKKDIVGEPIRTEIELDPETGTEIETPVYKYDDATIIRIAAIPELDYETVVRIMDITYSKRINGIEEKLFPQPILGQITTVYLD